MLCKEIGAKLATRDSNKNGFTVNTVAEELGLVDGHGPGAVLALVANVPLRSASISANAAGGEQGGVAGSTMRTNGLSVPTDLASTAKEGRTETHFYGYMLEACEKLFEGELDQATFEENMRFLFGTKVRVRLHNACYPDFSNISYDSPHSSSLSPYPLPLRC